MVPSRLSEVYWGNTYGDIKYRLKIRVGEAQATHSQMFEALCNTVSMALGGKEESSEAKSARIEQEAPKNKTEAMAQFRSVFG